MRNNCRDNKCNPCDFTVECQRPTSGLVYDGCDLPLWGVRNGDSLNTVLENAHRAFKLLFDNTAPVYVEHFKNPQSVHLSVRPIEVMMITYCGGVVPSTYWNIMGQDISIDSSICTDSPSEVTVVYKGPAKNLFNTNCIV